MNDPQTDPYADGMCTYGEDQAPGSGCIKPAGHDGAHLVTPGDIDVEPSPPVRYPHPDGDLTVLGPEIFTDGEVICWKGENFVRQVAPIADGLAATTCSAQHRRFDDGRLCIRAAQHHGDHIDERGFHWSDTVAVYPLADGMFRTGANPQAELRRLAAEAPEPAAQAEACAQHPNAPVIGGMCGGCTQYPADMGTRRPPMDPVRILGIGVCPSPESHNWGCGCPSDVAAAIASCPGHEMAGPSPCRCPCEGCKHSCAAHQPAAVPAVGQTDEEATS